MRRLFLRVEIILKVVVVVVAAGSGRSLTKLFNYPPSGRKQSSGFMPPLSPVRCTTQPSSEALAIGAPSQELQQHVMVTNYRQTGQLGILFEMRCS